MRKQGDARRHAVAAGLGQIEGLRQVDRRAAAAAGRDGDVLVGARIAALDHRAGVAQKRTVAHDLDVGGAGEGLGVFGQEVPDPVGTPGEQVIYVVSDGEETCGGDPVAVARRINSGRTRAVVNVA